MHVIRLNLTRQFVRVCGAGKASFVSHMVDATRFDTEAESARVMAAIPHSLGAKRMEVRK